MRFRFAKMSRRVWLALVLCMISRASCATPSYRKSTVQEVKQMAAALELTSQLNARLNCELEAPRDATPLVKSANPSGIQGQLRGGGTAVAVKRHSVFASKISSARKRMSLENHLSKLFDILQFTEIEATLAMIYLDRACSVDTLREGDRCPFCSPSTVHNLVSTALLIAVAAVRKIDIRQYYAVLAKELDVPNCETLVEWMRKSLGEEGIFVTPDTLEEFQRVWRVHFGSRDN